MRRAYVSTIFCLFALSCASTVDLAKRKGGGGGGGHGGGGYSGGGSHSSGSVHATGGAGVQRHQSDECYDQSLNPAPHGKSKAWIQTNANSDHGNTSDAAGQNFIRKDYANANWWFDIFDVYFNGSFSVTLEPPASSSSCSKIVSQTINNAYFRVGELEKSNSTYSRKKYDTNQFYFRLGRSTSKDFRCPTTPNKLFTSFESSNSNLESRVVWKLEDKKSDDHFNISGSITTEKASFNNHFNYLTSSKPAENGSAACPTHFQVFALTKANNATMTGSVSASEAKLLWTFTDLNTHWTVKGNFSGTWWNQGAKLITTAAQPATTGQAVRIIPPRQSVWSKHRGYIVLGIVFGVIILAIILIIICVSTSCFTTFKSGCCCCWRKEDKSYQETESVDNYKAWLEESAYSQQPPTATSIIHLSEGLPSPSPSTQRLLEVDSSYHSQTASVSPVLSAQKSN